MSHRIPYGLLQSSQLGFDRPSLQAVISVKSPMARGREALEVRVASSESEALRNQEGSSM